MHLTVVCRRSTTHNGLVQCISNTLTYQFESIPTFIIKTNHLNWYVIVQIDKMTNFTFDDEHRFMSLQISVI